MDTKKKQFNSDFLFVVIRVHSWINTFFSASLRFKILRSRTFTFLKLLLSHPTDRKQLYESVISGRFAGGKYPHFEANLP